MSKIDYSGENLNGEGKIAVAGTSSDRAFMTGTSITGCSLLTGSFVRVYKTSAGIPTLIWEKYMLPH